MSDPVDVLIVGAGPVGLTLACHLRRLGVSIRLIERRAGLSVHSKAIGLQYRVSEVLARLGIVDRFIQRGASPTNVNVYTASKRLVQLRFSVPDSIAGIDAFLPRAILIPQSETESILLEHLRELGGDVEWETELRTYREHHDLVIANVTRQDQPSEVSAKWLVSCEGAHSVVRAQAGLPFHGKTYPLAFVMADVAMVTPLSHEENHVWIHEDGSLAALPLPPAHTWRLFVEITGRQQADQQPTIDDVRHYLARRAPQMKAMIVGDPLWLSEFRINCRMVDHMRRGRTFLAGDAAHIHSPTGGQGITTGVQDAANLSWKLARVCRNGAPPALLHTYDEERLPHAAEVLRETDRTTRLMFAPSALLRAVRDLLVLPMLRRAWVQRRMFGKLSQLHTHHRGSSLSRERIARLRRRPIRAGDRAPDVAFIDTASLRQTTLFALMGTLRPIVLFDRVADGPELVARLRRLDVDAYSVRSMRVSGSSAQSQLLDVHGDFSRLYGFTREFVCLIRPDGHIGLVLAPARLAELISYLEMLCDPAIVRAEFSGLAPFEATHRTRH